MSANITTQELTGNPDIDGLLTGIKWDTLSLTYSFPTSATQYPDYTTTEPNDGFAPLSISEQVEVNWIMDQLMSFTNLSLTYDPSGMGDIRMAHTSDAPSAYTYFPSDIGSGGDAWFGTAASLGLSVASDATYSWYTHLHEIGHALGLKHSFDNTGTDNFSVIPPDHDAMEYTVMSYRSFEFGPTTGITNDQYGYPQTYMIDDIAALQTMYGANYTSHAGNDVYSWNPINGNFMDNGTVLLSDNGDRIFMTIWDGGGIDTYDMSNYSTGVSIDLRPGAYSITSIDQEAKLGNGITAHGNIYNALEFEGNPASLIENAIGGAGDDILRGNAGDNTLTGGLGHDKFVFDSLIGHDTITDFQPGIDSIDLSNIPGIFQSSDIQFNQTQSGELITISPGNDILIKGTEALDTDITYDPSIISYDIAGTAGFTYRLYQAAFDRAPDITGLSFNVHLLDTTLNDDQMAAAFAASPEFITGHGNTTDQQFVEALYHNVLGRAPDSDGEAGWLALMQAGLTRGSVLIGFSESIENHALVDPHLEIVGIRLDPTLL